MTLAATSNHSIPQPFLRELEARLIDLAASGNTDSATWLNHGSPFFMGGLAVLLAGARRDFDREKYLELAEELYPGVTEPEVFERWLKRTPVRAARFLPRVRQQKKFLQNHAITTFASSLEEIGD